MNKHIKANDLVAPKVTTGPITGSRKIHVSPEAAPDIRVLFLTSYSDEDAVRATGPTMVRWIWSELSPFDGVVRRLRYAFGLRRR